MTKIKGQQKELTAQVNAKRKQDAKLKNMISAMIRREIEIARDEAAKKEKERFAALKKIKLRQTIILQLTSNLLKQQSTTCGAKINRQRVSNH